RHELGRDYPIIDVDGVRVNFQDGWGLLRASNTQPILVLRFEALTQERLNELETLILDKVKSALTEFQGS
ncbi:MAG: phosphomannomutase, partial [Bacillota bacterium]|nr:phosphomannomutase [Bacillota bacterium]